MSKPNKNATTKSKPVGSATEASCAVARNRSAKRDRSGQLLREYNAARKGGRL